MSEIKTKYKFIQFEQCEYGWYCLNRKHTDTLGLVAYYAPWKQNVFEPLENAVFSASCLLDIADFLNQLNGGQK